MSKFNRGDTVYDEQGNEYWFHSIEENGIMVQRVCEFGYGDDYPETHGVNTYSVVGKVYATPPKYKIENDVKRLSEELNSIKKQIEVKRQQLRCAESDLERWKEKYGEIEAYVGIIENQKYWIIFWDYDSGLIVTQAVSKNLTFEIIPKHNWGIRGKWKIKFHDYDYRSRSYDCAIVPQKDFPKGSGELKELLQQVMDRHAKVLIAEMESDNFLYHMKQKISQVEMACMKHKLDFPRDLDRALSAKKEEIEGRKLKEKKEQLAKLQRELSKAGGS